MKFAHELQETLEKEGFPPGWIATAIPYSKLKKLLKKVQLELESLGLDRQTLSQLAPPSDDPTDRRGSGVAIQYEIDGKIKLVPKLTLFIQVEGGSAVDAILSPETREYLEHLARSQPGSNNAGQYEHNPPMPGLDTQVIDRRCISSPYSSEV
ncbi:uncharacterized protein LY89DRAFT_244509 [Mollisia scopiformis]|uniref:SPX domain-containing protein n=1 Tax=Mollisia scopiformis TaxID=149040 RepID=A0A194WRF4_MOLSC|nr:uncharacterized protein LY89DRAFT_244509 [Mollisia scopiformis]KUJ10596.1 hypothetical protein LY89DRAFT_244509 [Mollisia scopiformis]